MGRGKQLRRKGIVLMLALLFAGVSVRAMANPCVRRPVAQFIYFYQQGEDLGLWERVLYGVLMTKSTTEPSS